MLKFIHTFMRAWRMATTMMKFSDIYDHPDMWALEDVNQLRQYINTASGQKLMQRLVNMVFKSAITATEWPNEAKYYVGIARGVAMTVNAFQEHFLASPAVRNSVPSGKTK